MWILTWSVSIEEEWRRGLGHLKHSAPVMPLSRSSTMWRRTNIYVLLLWWWNRSVIDALNTLVSNGMTQLSKDSFIKRLMTRNGKLILHPNEDSLDVHVWGMDCATVLMFFRLKMNGPLPSSVNSFSLIPIIDMGYCFFFTTTFNLWFN